MSWTGFEPASFGMTNQHSTPELPTIFLFKLKSEMGIEPMT
jgi:hypothetical protein